MVFSISAWLDRCKGLFLLSWVISSSLLQRMACNAFKLTTLEQYPFIHFNESLHDIVLQNIRERFVLTPERDLCLGAVSPISRCPLTLGS